MVEASHGDPSAFRDVHARPAPRSVATDGPARHVWVSTTAGRVPGLLWEWESRNDGWWGLAVFPGRGEPGQSDWVMVSDWVPAHRLEQA